MKMIVTCTLLCLIGLGFILAQEAPPREREHIQAQIRRLHAELETAEKAGNHLQAQRLRERIHALERECHALETRERPHPETPAVVERLLAAAEGLERIGRHEQAKELRRQAERLQSRRNHRDREQFEPQIHQERPQLERELVAFWQELEPEKLQQLQQLKNRPELYYLMLKDLRGEMEELQRLRRRSPQRFQEIVESKRLSRQTWELARRYEKEFAPAVKTEIKQELRRVLEKIFQLKIRRHEKEIQHLLNEVNQLKSRLQRYIEHKDRIIDKRVSRMLKQNNSLEFDW